MCFFGGGGGGGNQPPQIVYKDAPIAPLPAPMPPATMSSGVIPASALGEGEEGADQENMPMGTSIFKINRDPVDTSEYDDQNLDSGIAY